MSSQPDTKHALSILRDINVNDKESRFPLYFQIAKSIRETIVKSLIPADTPMPSERILADQIGVTRGTIRRAYETLLDDGLIRKENKKRAVVTRSWLLGEDSSSSFLSLGLVLPLDFSYYVKDKDWNVFEYISGIIEEAAERNCVIHLISLPVSQELNKINSWLQQVKAHTRGLIHFGPRVNGPDAAMDLLLELRVPQVFVAGLCKREHVVGLRRDECQGIGAAMRHLRELGHRRIAVLAFVSEEGRIFVGEAHHRFGRIMAALNKAGGSDSDGLSKQFRSMEDIKSCLMDFMGLTNPPTAFFCSHDSIALAAIDLLRNQGLSIPDDISIVGIDNMPQSSESVPSLTTVSIPRQEIGRSAVRLLLDAVERRSVTVTSPREPFASALVVRASTGIVRTGRPVRETVAV